tara:strand:- start:194 stop:388 length:195 start_codon:yes stop_codon:yes gene_type:complete
MEIVNELNNGGQQQQDYGEEDEMVDMDGMGGMDDEDNMQEMDDGQNQGYQLPEDQMDDNDSSPG